MRLELARQPDRTERRESEGDSGGQRRRWQRDRGGSRHADCDELLGRHPERTQRRILQLREGRHTRERLSKQDEGQQRADGRRQPERLCLVVDRALDLGGSVLLRVNTGSTAGPDSLPEPKNCLPEGGEIGGAMPETNGEKVIEVAAVESVDPVERRGEQDLADRVRVRRRLHADDLQPYESTPWHEPRERLDDVPAVARLQGARDRPDRKMEGC